MALALLSLSCARPWLGGIHASLHVRPRGPLQVERVQPNGPAAIAGLRVGESVLAIDGVPTEDMSEQELRDRVRGDVGSVVVLRVRDGAGAERDVRIERGP